MADITPASIPDVSSPNTLPAIDCPDPGIFLSDSRDPTDLTKRPARRRRRNPNARGRGTREFVSGNEEQRQRALLLQAAVLISRGRLNQAQTGSPFDLRGGAANPLAPDNSAFEGLLNNASVPAQPAQQQLDPGAGQRF